jgi:hypothetical protein
VLAVIVGPLPLVLYLFNDRPVGLRINAAVVLFAIISMHLFFWPPALATQRVGRYLRLESTLRLLLPMAVVSWLWALGWQLLIVHLSHTHYEWYRAARDSLDPAALCTFGFILFRFLWNPESRLNWFGGDSTPNAQKARQSQ